MNEISMHRIKSEERQEIEKQMAEFFSNGGSIEKKESFDSAKYFENMKFGAQEARLK